MVDELNATTSTLLFSDIVGSTQLIQQLGEKPAHSAFEAHRADLKRALALTRGRELQWLGDGAMAAFCSAGDAVRCAILIQKLAARTRHPSIHLRVGVHAGDTLCARHTGHPFGLPVVIARRLCDLGSEGQILCSQAIEIMLIGRSDLRFEPAGTARVKGLDVDLPICQVLWRSEATAYTHKTRHETRPSSGERVATLTCVPLQSALNM